jgi:hypothetical protein
MVLGGLVILGGLSLLLYGRVKSQQLVVAPGVTQPAQYRAS